MLMKEFESGRRSTLKFLNNTRKPASVPFPELNLFFGDNQMANNTVQKVRELVAPTAEELGYGLWDVEFVREGANNILRITIDKEGGITIDDCEKMHRKIDPILDEADPISQSYFLEVSSPGLGRQIKNAEQAEKCLGKEVRVKLYSAGDDGRKEYTGTLEAFGNDNVTVIADGIQMTEELKKIAKLSLADDD